MSIEAKKLDNEPIIIMSFTPPLNLKEDIQKANEDAAKLSKEIKGDIYRIEDVSQIEINFGNLVEAMLVATKGDLGAIGATNLHTIVVNPPSKLLQIAIEGLKQSQYGNIDVTAFPTLEEALASARQRIASEKSSV